jgi:hypothetical protein
VVPGGGYVNASTLKTSMISAIIVDADGTTEGRNLEEPVAGEKA